MDKKTKQAVIGAGIVLAIIIIVIAAFLIKLFTPSDKVMELSEYYETLEDEVLVILQDEIYEQKGLLSDGVVYLDYETIVEKFNQRFYWDANENILIYTTPTEIIRTEVGSKEYHVNKSKKELDYEIVKTDGDQAYVALDFVALYSDMRYEFYETPNRIVVQYKWGDYLFSTVKKATQLRYEPDIKSDILVELKPEDLLTYIDTSEVVKKGFRKVITVDGIIGYVKTKYISESFYDAVESDYQEPEYTSITKDETINLVWHQVTNTDANNGLISLLEKTKGVTTISPTWYKVNSNEGTISSLASETYIERAHSLGIEVWALVDDFDPNIDMLEVLSYTSRREKLTNELIASAIKYNLDGINVDFERITLENGKNFIQFIRELSVKCRNNGIVLSIDNYVPKEYSAYYNITEQGIVADYVIIMAYDEHHGGSDVSGSVASIYFVNEGIEDTLEMVSGDKVIIGIPFYTRLWKETPENGSVKVTSDAYAMSYGEELLRNNGVEPVWDEAAGQYYGEYEKEGSLYKIWLEEEESIEAKLKLIDQAEVAGIAGWKLGLEKESIWNIIIKYVN
ncbi:MAG: glycoside hydrolase family 18 [Lachnospiraceae bacterium]|jgi:spore germination protein YaaH|nr:glycoside hydrolase family 18 [Lachnospiraceae bacterium]